MTNQVDERTIQKYKKEAQEKKRDTWYLAYVMDTNEEEKDKGKTVEVGRAKFSTANKRYTLLDAPGHSKYVPNMIEGTAQADVGILVISARKGEFEAGFDKGGQTREHAMLAKTLGIQKLIVLVNKMDEKTVKWSEERYNQIQSKLSPFLKRWGYNVKKDVTFVPSSGYTGANLRDRVEPSMCPWYKGESLFQTLDGMDSLERDPKAPMRLPVVARYKDRGTLCVLGKLESGSCQIGDELMLMPTKKKITCVGMMVDDEEVNIARPGENLVLKVKGCEEEDILGGFVVCDSARPCPRSKKFNAQIQVLGLLEHKPLITAGYSAILHTHSLSCEVDITTLVAEINKKTGKKTGRPRFLKRGAIGLVTFETKQTIAIESFKNNAQLGRFTIRDEGKTIAIGKVVAMKEE